MVQDLPEEAAGTFFFPADNGEELTDRFITRGERTPHGHTCLR
jgi:hypothetical protein